MARQGCELPPEKRQCVDASVSDEDTARLLAWATHRARTVARRLPTSVDVDDLIGAAGLGLADALRLWTERTGNFEAYARARIRGAIMDELRSSDPLTRHQRRIVRDESDSMNAKVLDMRSRATAMHTLSEGEQPHDVVEPESRCDQQRRSVRVQSALETLPSRLRMVVEQSYLHERPLVDIGLELGISEARVRQLRREAEGRLRTTLQA